MPITLTVQAYRGAAPGAPLGKLFDRAGGTVGRGAGSDLLLDDPTKYISRSHARVEFRDGGWFLVDIGSNPSLVDGRPVGPAGTARLAGGERIDIGDYVLVATVEPEPVPGPTRLPEAPMERHVEPLPPPSAPAPAMPAYGHAGDSLAEASILRLGGSFGSGFDPGADPLGLNLAPPDARAQAYRGAESDHAPPEQAAFVMPVLSATPAPAIPHDYDPLADLLAAPPAAQPAPQAMPRPEPRPVPPPVSQAAPQPAPQPELQAAPQPPSQPQPQPQPQLPSRSTSLPAADPFEPVAVWVAPRQGTQPAGEAAPPPDPATVWMAPQPAAPAAEPAPVAKAPEPAPRPAARPASATAAGKPAAAPAADDNPVLQALLRGLGLPELHSRHGAEELAELAGTLLREATAGTIATLMARTLTKRESRVEMTMIAPQANNPLKFFPDAGTALAQMLQGPMPGYLPPRQAFAGAFQDLRAHELAVMAGTRAALAGVLRRFDPKAIEERLQAPGMLDKVFAGSRKTRMWDRMVELYDQMALEADEDFQRLFGEAFAAAYEEQVRRLRDAGQ